jgi:hypothetical protein
MRILINQISHLIFSEAIACVQVPLMVGEELHSEVHMTNGDMFCLVGQTATDFWELVIGPSIHDPTVQEI